MSNASRSDQSAPFQTSTTLSIVGSSAGNRRLDAHAMFVRQRQQVVDDVVSVGALLQVIDGRHVQQHFEIECRIGLQRAQDLLDVVALDRDREIAAEFAHADQFFRETSP